MMSDDDVKRFSISWDRLAVAVSKLEPDAVEVLAVIAERLVMGREKYGDLTVNQDDRNWWREFGEEMADGAVYAACKLLAESRKG
jgi:hypothetical protein